MPNEGRRTLHLGTPESQRQTSSPKGTVESRLSAPGLPVKRLSGRDPSSRRRPARRFQGEEDQVVTTTLASGRKEGLSGCHHFWAAQAGLARSGNPSPLGQET